MFFHSIKHLINKITPDDIELMFMHCSLTFIQYAVSTMKIRFDYNNFHGIAS